MRFEDLRFDWVGSGDGVSLFYNDKYLATYESFTDCIIDLAFHFRVAELDEIWSKFVASNKKTNIKCFNYRGACSEYFFPTERVYWYVFYRDTLKDLLECFSKHEIRASSFPDYFLYGVQGIGIHLFDVNSASYKFWVGGDQLKSVDDVIIAAKQAKKTLPQEIIDEYNELKHIDVFISHKSEDVLFAKEIYDLLVKEGYSVFLSEISLPASNSADYFTEIDEVLENVKHMVVVGSSAENIKSGWVEFEWRSFANELISGRKSGKLITVTKDGLPIENLPLTLRQYEVIPKKDVDSLLTFLK